MIKLILISALFLTSLSAHPQWSETYSDEILIRGGWLFDGVSDSRRKNTGILIRDGKILEVDVNIQNQMLLPSKI
mgnify:CR=1 FL=1